MRVRSKGDHGVGAALAALGPDAGFAGIGDDALGDLGGEILIVCGDEQTQRRAEIGQGQVASDIARQSIAPLHQFAAVGRFLGGGRDADSERGDCGECSFHVNVSLLRQINILGLNSQARRWFPSRPVADPFSRAPRLHHRPPQPARPSRHESSHCEPNCRAAHRKGCADKRGQNRSWLRARWRGRGTG